MDDVTNENENIGSSGTLSLAKYFGFFGISISNTPTFLDRWRWLAKRLPHASFNEKLIDVGCGTGGITIGAARRGYDALGLSWDERPLAIANMCARHCRASNIRFEKCDIRHLDSRADLIESVDTALCFEAIEHIIDDRKLVSDIANCLKPGGRLLLTTPYYHRHLIRKDVLPFEQLEVENGGHVRLGYTTAMLRELTDHAGLVMEEISYCSGFFTQKITSLMHRIKKIHPRLGHMLVPLWILPRLFDGLIARTSGYPYYSICVEAYKPRF